MTRRKKKVQVVVFAIGLFFILDKNNLPYHTAGMATMTMKSTFTLDKDTTEAIRNLALNWKVSQAEVVRKSIQLAMTEAVAKKNRSPLSIIESLEKKKKPSQKEIASFKKTMEANKKGWDF